MNRTAYYERMKNLARQIRASYGLSTPRVQKSDLRGIYRDLGIKIDLWSDFRDLRGAYFDDDLGPTVVIARGLPVEPTVFTMGHELKHHLVDRGKALSYCGPANENEPIEIGAEVFAAELIFPDEDFIQELNRMGVGRGACTPEAIATLKHETKTTLSYAGLEKKARFLGFTPADFPAKVQWKKLEEQIYGEPIYKRIQRYHLATIQAVNQRH